MRRHFAPTSTAVVICVSLLCLIAPAAPAQDAGAPVRAQISEKPESVEVPERGIKVPMSFRGNMPAFEVSVNGKGPFTFALDTGGMGLARADVSLVKQLNLAKTGEIQAGDGSGQNRVTMDLVKLDEVRLGDAIFKGLAAPSRDYNRGRPDHIDGILGINLFQDHLLTLDYPAKELRLAPGELPEADGNTILNLAEGQAVPALEIEVAGQKILCHIDSGNMGGLILPTALAEKLPLVGEPVVVGRAKTVANEFEIKSAQLDGSVTIGGHEIKNPTVTFAEIFRTGNIGAGVLREFAMTLDQKNGRVRFERPKQD